MKIMIAVAIIATSFIVGCTKPPDVVKNTTKSICADTSTPTLTATMPFATPTKYVEIVKPTYHNQMDVGEYVGEFSLPVAQYFGNYDIRWNFCGAMSLLNVVEIMSGGQTELTVVEMVNKYFVEGDKISSVHEGRGSAFRAPNGSMYPTAIYYMADKIGKDTGLWQTSVVYGSIDFTVKMSIEVADMSAVIAESKEQIFDKGGVLIAHVGIPSGGVFSYYHFLVITDMRLNNLNEPEMFVIDSLGKSFDGYAGWVNVSKYTIPANYNTVIFTGIYNLYGITPLED